MGPKYYGAPTLPEWDGESCTSEFMENALWDQGTQEGYITGPNGTAGNLMVGGAGQLQQGMGRDYPFALPMDSVKRGWQRKDITDVYGAKSIRKVFEVLLKSMRSLKCIRSFSKSIRSSAKIIWFSS